MATLLMRTPELSGTADTLALSNHAHVHSHVRLHVDDLAPRFSSLPPQSKAPGGSCSGRTRRTKSVLKKQPQRGLGVAQLEKLRLQEQSKQEAACLASLQCPGTEQCGRLCFSSSVVGSHVKASPTLHLLPEHCPAPSLSLATSSDSPLSSFVSAPDAEASPSIVSLSSAHSFSGSNAFREHSKVYSLDSQDDGISRTAASADLFSDIFAGQAAVTDADLKAEKKEEEARVHAERVRGERGSEALCIYPLLTFGKDGGAAPFAFVDLDYFDPQAGCGDSSLAQRNNNCVFPVVAGNKLKELSSFQSYASSQVWSSGEKALGRKRPWLDMQDWHGSSLGNVNVLDLNSESGERDGVRTEQKSFGALNVLENQVGVHYTTGIVRTALGNTSSQLFGKGRQSSGPTALRHDTGCPSDVPVFSSSSSLKRICTVKDSCSSAAPPSPYSSIGATGCMEPEEISEVAPRGSATSDNDFLSLGLSSAYHGPQRDIEQAIQGADENTSKHDDLKHCILSKYFEDKSDAGIQLSIFFKEGDKEKAELKQSCSTEPGTEACMRWKELPEQSSAGVFTKAVSAFGSGFTDHSNPVKKESEDPLDLRLKLAL